MLKALFLDLDETLCDTTGANNQALVIMAGKVKDLFGEAVDEQAFTAMYLKGIYRELDERYAELLLPVDDEGAFRLALIELILLDLGVVDLADGVAKDLQQCFDTARSECFDFFPTIKELLLELRDRYTLVVITNGPEFSQLAKINAVNLADYVDHIIIGGQEKEQKPAVSIFSKALALAGCEPHEVIHVGDSLAADIAGANKSQIPSVWVSHNKGLDPELNIKPTYTIQTPQQLRELIEDLTGC